MRQIIRLTEGDLHRLVLEVVNNVMNQGSSPSADAVAKMIYALTGINVKQRMLGESKLYEGKGHTKSKRPATTFRFKKDENGEKIINPQTGEPEIEEVLVNPTIRNGRKIETLADFNEYIASLRAAKEAEKEAEVNSEVEAAKEPLKLSSNEFLKELLVDFFDLLSRKIIKNKSTN